MRFPVLAGSIATPRPRPHLSPLLSLPLTALVALGGCATSESSSTAESKASAVHANGAASAPAASTGSSSRFLAELRPLTFAGRRSGEAYFSPDGRELVFQSEREPGNPFYQIYRAELASGETTRVSPGIGRATCAWFHPDGVRILFASTHEDPEAELAQAVELEKRAKGKRERYSWDFDPHYDLFLTDAAGRPAPLARARGYDAEGSISPDGRFVVFASNRHAYQTPLSATDRDRLAEDPSSFVDLYRLELSSGELVRLTTSPGYDGGPFFSPDGKRVVWRRFSEDGVRAEIFSMAIDGSDARALTRLGAMSWAPYYHPSGDYVIFATNLQGFDNFELYLVDAAGIREPVRVTDRPGFDGLPVFSPDGRTLVWTSNRTPGKQSQLFRARWDDAAAREALGLPASTPPSTSTGPLALPPTTAAITAADFAVHVAALTDPRTEGRGTGTPGEALAADYVVSRLKAAGLLPAGDPQSFRHRFEYGAGVALGQDNALQPEPVGSGAKTTPALPAPVVDVDWRPLAFSRNGPVAASPVVFAGYGLVSPAGAELPALDEYAGLDVKGRWVMVLRDLPQAIGGAQRQYLQRHAALRYKAMVARDRGARGILFVGGPRSGFREPLVALRFDAALAGSGLAVISVSPELAERWLAAAGRSLDESQAAIDAALGRAIAGNGGGNGAGKDDGDGAVHGGSAGSDGAGRPLRFVLPDFRLAAKIDLETLRGESDNILGRLQVGTKPSPQTIVLGAHLDHLGHGEGSGSLADASEAGQIHPGADDNASGVAVLLEIAESLAARRAGGEDLGRRDFVFAAWSGEELGLLGSDRWVDENVNPHSHDEGPVVALNFDMVGRLTDEVVVQGAGSSPDFRALLERAAMPGRVALSVRDDAYLPTDSTSFYAHELPILSAFTGAHAEYHTPRDRPELLNGDGAAAIGELFARVAVELSRAESAPEFVAQPLPAAQENRGGLRVYLGTIPDYSQTDVQGVLLGGVAPGGPAEAAGLRRGDTIVEVDGGKIENLYDFTYALEALRVGEKARIVVLREGQRLTVEVVPRSRD